jgi:hypothetical protein
VRHKTRARALKGGNKPKCQACVQQQVKKKLMFGVIICVAERGDQESREAAGRQARS